MNLFNRNQTFKPIKAPRSNDYHRAAYELHARVENSLSEGHTNTLMFEAVKLPPTENLNEWIAIHVIEFYNKINTIFGEIFNCCTSVTCPKMTAGDSYLYLWRDPNSQDYKKPTEVRAQTYISLALDWCENLLNDEKIFPTDGRSFPKDYRAIVEDIFKKIFRAYAHIFINHYKDVAQISGFDKQLNFNFKHFISFAINFYLLKERELEPMRSWLQTQMGLDIEKVLKQKKKQMKKMEETLETQKLGIKSAKEDKRGERRGSRIVSGENNGLSHQPSVVIGGQKTSEVLSSSPINGDRASSPTSVSLPIPPAVPDKDINVVNVEVVSCKNLLAKDAGGTSDPYVTVCFEKDERQTAVVKKNCNPVFSNERFTFTVNDLKEHIRFAVFDCNNLTKNSYIAQVSVPLDNFLDERVHDITLDLEDTKTNEPNPGQLRVRIQFTSSESGAMKYLSTITSLEYYEPFLHFLVDQSPVTFLGLFDNNRLTGLEEKVWRAILYFTRFADHTDAPISSIVSDFDLSLNVLKYAVRIEVETCERPAQMLRSNSVATKLVSNYMKMFGADYLKKILTSITIEICRDDLSLEVDPMKAAGADTEANMKKLLDYAQRYIDTILDSVSELPDTIRAIAAHMREQVQKKFANDVEGAVILIAVSGLIFLRFLCPALTAPQLYQLVPTAPGKNAARTLMLIGKILQQTANNLSFSKEQFMIPANDFITRNVGPLKQFFDELSTAPSGQRKRDPMFGRDDKLLWALHTLHQFFYDNDTIWRSTMDEAVKTMDTSFAGFPVESVYELNNAIISLHTVIVKLGPPPQLSLQHRQRVASSFSKQLYK
jgi:hypothetical protein